MDTESGTEFADLMTRAGLGIQETAGLLGVNDRTVRRYINGEAKRVDRLKIDKLREVANERSPVDRPEGFRFIDLFAGIGGLRRPFEEIGGRCIFTSEWDPFCKETYTVNFPEPADSEHRFVGDIRPYAADPRRVPAHDVLLAGFPLPAVFHRRCVEEECIGPAPRLPLRHAGDTLLRSGEDPAPSQAAGLPA